jgi:hypothetical protein
MVYFNKICKQCKKEFTVNRPPALVKKLGEPKFCNYRCYWDSKKGIYSEHLKKTQGIGAKKLIGRPNPSTRKRNLTNNPMWNKSKKIQKKPFTTINWNGYSMVYIGKGKYRREHILIMEKHIGRKLESNECVHHINGYKQDNRLENLQLMTKSEHMKLHHKKII